MITILRNSLKDGGMTTIVWVAVGSMIIGSALPLVMKKTGEGWALRVNGTEISYSIYATEVAMMRDYVSMLRAQYGQFAEYILQHMGFSDAQNMATQQLINQQLMVYGYSVQGISVGKIETDHKLRDKQFIEESCADLLPPFLYKDGQLDVQLLKIYLQRRGLTMEQLQQRLTERIGSVFLRNVLQYTAYVPQAARAAAEQAPQQAKNIALVRISLGTYKKQNAQSITDDEILAFYEQENARTQRYYIPEQRSGTCWKYTLKGYDVVIEPAAVEAYYNEHKQSKYTKEQAKVVVRALACATREEAGTVREQLTNGNATIAALAAQCPFDDESARNGGQLKPITRGAGDRIIERAAFVLANDGDISPVLEHNGKFVIIERVSKTAAVITPLAGVRDEIVQQLKTARFKEQCLQDLQALSRDGNEATIVEFAKEHSAEKSELHGTIEEAKSAAEKTLFTLERGAYMALVQGADCVLVRLDSIEALRRQPFDAVKNTVKNDLVETKARKQLADQLTQFKHTLVQKGLNTAADEHGLSVERHKGITLTDTDAHATLKKQGVELTTLNKLEKLGTLTTVERNEDVVVVFLEGIETVSTKEPVNLRMAVAPLVNQAQETVVTGYIASLYRDAKIERNDMLALLDEENTI